LKLQHHHGPRGQGSEGKTAKGNHQDISKCVQTVLPQRRTSGMLRWDKIEDENSVAS